jgi:hypothetical protein
MPTLVGVHGYYIQDPNSYHTEESIDRDVLILPDLLVESFTDDPATVLRPAFDANVASVRVAALPGLRRARQLDRPAAVNQGQDNTDSSE